MIVAETKSIIGAIEHGSASGNPTYSSSIMFLTSKSNKIEISLSDPAIQFTKNQAKDLIATLTEWANRNG